MAGHEKTPVEQEAKTATSHAEAHEGCGPDNWGARSVPNISTFSGHIARPGFKQKLSALFHAAYGRNKDFTVGFPVHSPNGAMTKVSCRFFEICLDESSQQAS